LLRFTNVINEWVGRTASWLTIAMMVTLVVEVVGRYGFSHPFIWSGELNQMFMFIMSMLGGGYVQLHDSHLRVDILYNHFSKKGKAIIDIATSPLILYVCFLLIWKGTDYAWDSFLKREHSSTMWSPPLYHIKWIIPVSGFLFMLQTICKFVSDFEIIINRTHTEE